MATLLFTGKELLPCDLVVGSPVQGSKHFPLSLIDAEGLPHVCDVIMEHCQRFPKIEVVVSLSVLDAAFYPEGLIGGLSTRELLYLISRLKVMKNFASLRILEQTPLSDRLKAELAKPF